MIDQIIMERNKSDNNHKWNLSSLFVSDTQWENSLKKLEAGIPHMRSFKGTLGNGPKEIRKCLDYVIQYIGKLDERLENYALLRLYEDLTSNESVDRYNRYFAVATEVSSAMSFIQPELLALEETVIEHNLKSDELEEYRTYINNILSFREYTLSAREEALLAKIEEIEEIPEKIYTTLINVDLNFGSIQTSSGEVEITNSTFNIVMQDPDRKVRKKGYKQFYNAFNMNSNTLANLYHENIKKELFITRVRGYSSNRSRILKSDNIPGYVYDNLIANTEDHLSILHRYLNIRRKKMALDKLRYFDMYVPLVNNVQKGVKYEEGVEMIYNALLSLGDEYSSTLRDGLLNGWVDRYENKGKYSRAFSAGSYSGSPYILMNYKENDLRHLFTLAHEGGHSMHTLYSALNNPFQHYNYSLFEAEVASMVNELLLAQWIMDNVFNTDEQKAYLINKLLDDIVIPIFRQVMIAQFEKKAHRFVEEGGTLTLDYIREEYRLLQETYFGPHVQPEDINEYEIFRIPHLYKAFYVYKYATGLTAAITLSQKINHGNNNEHEDYLMFLKSGGSRAPLDALKIAGVDLSDSLPYKKAMLYISELVDSFENIILS